MHSKTPPQRQAQGQNQSGGLEQGRQIAFAVVDHGTTDGQCHGDARDHQQGVEDMENGKKRHARLLPIVARARPFISYGSAKSKTSVAGRQWLH
jgi:hypothetical protein